MDLAEYMKKVGMTDDELAAQVKRDRSNVSRWRKKRTRPDFHAIIAIERVTEGIVSARDFEKLEAAR